MYSHGLLPRVEDLFFCGWMLCIWWCFTKWCGKCTLCYLIACLCAQQHAANMILRVCSSECSGMIAHDRCFFSTSLFFLPRCNIVMRSLSWYYNPTQQLSIKHDGIKASTICPRVAQPERAIPQVMGSVGSVGDLGEAIPCVFRGYPVDVLPAHANKRYTGGLGNSSNIMQQNCGSMEQKHTSSTQSNCLANTKAYLIKVLQIVYCIPVVIVYT